MGFLKSFITLIASDSPNGRPWGVCGAGALGREFSRI